MTPGKLVSLLFDLKFSTSATPDTVKMVYVAGILIAGLIFLFVIVSAFAESVAGGAMAFVIVLPIYVLSALAFRV